MGQTYNLDTEKRIIGVATETFGHLGYKQTSTRAIAQRVGITQPNLYHYFKNKEALYIGVIMAQLENITTQFSVILERTDSDITTDLTDMAQVLLQHDQLNFMMMHFDMAHTVSKQAQAIFSKAWEKKMLAPVCTLFEKYAVIEETLSFRDLGRLYFSQMGAIIHLFPQLSKKEVADRFVQLFLHGVL